MKRLITVGIGILGLTVSGGAPVFADTAPSIVVIDSATPARRMELPNPNLHIGETIVFNDEHPQEVTVHVGVWEANEVAAHLKNYPWTEYVLMLSGRVVITNDDGTQNEFKAGDIFVMPKGFTGIWDVREPMKKVIVKVGHPTAKGEGEILRVGPAQ